MSVFDMFILRAAASALCYMFADVFTFQDCPVCTELSDHVSSIFEGLIK